MERQKRTKHRRKKKLSTGPSLKNKNGPKVGGGGKLGVTNPKKNRGHGKDKEALNPSCSTKKPKSSQVQRDFTRGGTKKGDF